MPTYFKSCLCFAVSLLSPFEAFAFSPELEVSAKGEFSLLSVKQQPQGLQPWWQQGTGPLPYPDQHFAAGPQLFAVQLNTDSAWSATVHGQWHRIPTVDLGLTEAWMQYQPLPWSGYRFKAKAGYFYPAMSLENTDIAWSSPYSSHFSALNSWLAEELRARGLEVSLSRPGRFFQSDHSWQWVAGVFQGNDPLGSLISWRGFAIHPYQTNLGEEVRFANYPSIQQGALVNQPAWVQPTRELDHRTGYYTGIHWLYRQSTEIRAYHYDNNGDPTVFKHGQYAWDTRFQNLAIQQQISERWRFVGQWMDGSTEMGYKDVLVDYRVWFGLLSFEAEHFRLSARYDHWQQWDRDQNSEDDNNGRGHGWTLNLQYPLSENLSLALELNQLNSFQANRGQWQNWPLQQSFRQWQLILNWRFE